MLSTLKLPLNICTYTQFICACVEVVADTSLDIDTFVFGDENESERFALSQEACLALSQEVPPLEDECVEDNDLEEGQIVTMVSFDMEGCRKCTF